jgi:hypothetical protein
MQFWNGLFEKNEEHLLQVTPFQLGQQVNVVNRGCFA